MAITVTAVPRASLSLLRHCRGGAKDTESKQQGRYKSSHDNLLLFWLADTNSACFIDFFLENTRNPSSVVPAPNRLRLAPYLKMGKSCFK
jgi:hypothetical protein